MTVARILPDRDIRKLFGAVIIDADEKLLDPNGIKLRLGTEILFHSTGEEKKIERGEYVKISPGESVMICSMEKIDFRGITIHELFPKLNLMALITPTTTMVREGVTQASTKIDAGFNGNPNWALRNSSHKDLILQHGEPMFKLTFLNWMNTSHPTLNTEPVNQTRIRAQKAFSGRAVESPQTSQNLRSFRLVWKSSITNRLCGKPVIRLPTLELS